MGAVCSRKSTSDEPPESSDFTLNYINQGHKHADPLDGPDKTVMVPSVPEVMEKDLISPARKGVLFNLESNQTYDRDAEDGQEKKRLSRVLSDKAKTARSRTSTVARKGAAKMSEVGSLLGKAGHAGIGKTLEAIDTIGSTLTNLNGGGAAKGNKIGILAFEIANTVVKGNNLKLSLSEEEIKMLKEETLRSEGVQRLVAQDMDLLLRIAAADKRDELKIFAGEVVRFGNRCKDPQWHKLDRVFCRLGDELDIPKISKEHADGTINQLMTLAQHTAELYHELHTLDRCQADLKRKQAEDELYSGSQRGESISLLKSDLKSQQKHVKNLKKRSLWSKILEEVMEKLVDMVYYLHQELQRVFSGLDQTPVPSEGQLGASGLALHYANLITQIESLVSRPSSVPPNTRDTLYQGLPPSIKAALRNKLQSAYKDEQSVSEIREDMEKTLDWLAVVAANTTKAHHGFGWVGEWANTGSASDRRLPGHTDLTVLQTLHHADQTITEGYILELVVGLHHLVSRARSGTMNGHKSPIKSPIRLTCFTLPPPAFVPAVHKESPPCPKANGEWEPPTQALTPEDREMLSFAIKQARKFPLGTSKSQEFSISGDRERTVKRNSNRLSKSSSHSPSTVGGQNSSGPMYKKRQPSNGQMLPISPLDLDIDRIKELDVIDRVDSLKGSSAEP